MLCLPFVCPLAAVLVPVCVLVHASVLVHVPVPVCVPVLVRHILSVLALQQSADPADLAVMLHWSGGCVVVHWCVFLLVCL